MIAWVVFILLIAVVLMLGIEWLMARFGVRRANPESAPGGVREILTWIQRKRRR